MISYKETPDGVEIEVCSRQPMVYFDQWPLSKVAARPAWLRRITDVFADKGTLMISWTNVFELATVAGENANRIASFFNKVGEHWFPVAWNPFEVIEKEVTGGPEDGNPACISESFLRSYFPHAYGETLSLAKIIELTRDQQKDAKTELGTLKDRAKDFIDEIKDRHQKDPAYLDKAFPQTTFSRERPTQFVFHGLVRHLANERGWTFTPNDGPDLFHATVPTAYADIVLLDKHWTRRVRDLRLPPTQVRAYYEKDFEAFLDVLERSQVVP